ncbi:MAG: DUF6758 family protein [Marmoricola sp.]
MTLAAGCPRCPSPVTAGEDEWRCPDHGPITPLWRPTTAGYESLVEHLGRCGPFPTLMPWPPRPGWAVTDFGCVARPGHEARASFFSCSGASALDGVVEVSVVSEEAGVGLGARCAGVRHTDPGADIAGPPQARLHVDGRPLPMWAVSTSDTAGFDRSVFAGEAQGRWLWLVMHPASAAFLLNDEWVLSDVAGMGPTLVDLEFGATPSAW